MTRPNLTKPAELLPLIEIMKSFNEYRRKIQRCQNWLAQLKSHRPKNLMGYDRPIRHFKGL